MNTGLLRIVRNLFLEKEELNRLYGFINDRFNVFINQNTDRFGIIGSDSFLVEAGTNTATIKFTNDSYAVTSELNFIQQLAIDNIETTNLSNGIWYWLKIAYTNTVYEVGTVNIDVDGILTGTGTLFTDILRGQSAKAPSRISLYENDIKLGDYEVIDVDSDIVATISSSFNSPKTGLKYAVTGTFTLGETISEANKNIFVYDSVVYEWVIETSPVDYPPIGLDSENEFYIARIQKNGTSLTIQDKREKYFYLSKGESNSINNAPGDILKGFGENFYIWGCEASGGSGSPLVIQEGLMNLGGECCYCPAQELTGADLNSFYFVIDTQTSIYDRRIAKLIYSTTTPSAPYIQVNDLPAPSLSYQIKELLGGITDNNWHYVGDVDEPDTTFTTIKDSGNPGKARFRKDFTGMVYVECYATGESYTGTFFTLPAGYRPDRDLSQMIYANTVSNLALCSITAATGSIWTLGGFTSFSMNLCFKAA